MKIFTYLFIYLIMSSFALASTLEEAEKRWAGRGENINNARSAAYHFFTLGKKASRAQDYEEGATMYVRASLAAYYVASYSSGRERTNLFQRAYTYAESAIDIIEDRVTSYSEERVLSGAYLAYAAAKGRWKEHRGAMASSSAAMDLILTCNKIINLEHKDIFWYGPHRTLGVIYFKLYELLGRIFLNRSYENIKIAFDNTLTADGKVSVFGSTNIYYADVLRAKGREDEACRVLRDFSQRDPEILLKERIPETKTEIEMAKKRMKDFQCL